MRTDGSRWSGTPQRTARDCVRPQLVCQVYQGPRRLAAGQRTHHLHFYYEGHQNLIEVFAFCDLLREDPEARKQHQAVKLASADANPQDRSRYLAGKTEIVRDLLRVALALARQTREEKASSRKPLAIHRGAPRIVPVR